MVESKELSTTFTNPTGTPMMSAGSSFPSSMRPCSAMSAVGALPMAKMHFPGSCAAFSMETIARVTPRSFASAATSASDMKQCTSPPRRPRIVLLMPAFAICVSVTMWQPARSASIPFVTACGENTRFCT